MVPDFLNVAFIGESNKKTNNFLFRLLQLYNSNNLPKNTDFDIRDLIESRKTELQNKKKNTNLVWNFNLKKRETSVNLFSIDTNNNEYIDDNFSECINQCELALFYIGSEEDLDSEALKTKILITNILGLKHALIFIDTDLDIDNDKKKAFSNKAKNLFLKRNFKNNKCFFMSKFSKDVFDINFNSYFRILNTRKKSNRSLNLQISNTFTLSNKYTVLNGTILEGALKCGDFFKNNTNGTIHKIIDMQVHHKEVENAKRGSYVGIKIKITDLIDIGDILISVKDEFVSKPVQFITSQLLMLENNIENGSEVIMNYCGKDHLLKVSKIQKTIDKLNKTIEKNPEALNARETGMVALYSRNKINMTLYSENYKMGSFVLKDKETKKTIGVGIVKSLK